MLFWRVRTLKLLVKTLPVSLRSPIDPPVHKNGWFLENVYTTLVIMLVSNIQTLGLLR